MEQFVVGDCIYLEQGTSYRTSWEKTTEMLNSTGGGDWVHLGTTTLVTSSTPFYLAAVVSDGKNSSRASRKEDIPR